MKRCVTCVLIMWSLMGQSFAEAPRQEPQVCYKSYDNNRRDCVSLSFSSRAEAQFCQRFLDRAKKYVCLSARRYYIGCKKQYKKNTEDYNICMSSGGKLEGECYRVTVMECQKIYQVLLKRKALCRAVSTSCESERTRWKQLKNEPATNLLRKAAHKALKRCKKQFVSQCMRWDLK